jgi:hypothetical protein
MVLFGEGLLGALFFYADCLNLHVDLFKIAKSWLLACVILGSGKGGLIF